MKRFHLPFQKTNLLYTQQLQHKDIIIKLKIKQIEAPNQRRKIEGENCGPRKKMQSYVSLYHRYNQRILKIGHC
jgi:hypothetical protein